MFSALAYLPSFLIACTGGVIANLLNLPIPWLLGSLFAVGCMSLSGLPIKTAGFSRKAGLMVIGISYWWDRISFHPGNGFTFASFAFAGLVSLYFNYPLAISALLMGIGLAFHPTTVFVVPLLIYQWWQHKHRIKNLVSSQFSIPILQFLPMWMLQEIQSIIKENRQPS